MKRKFLAALLALVMVFSMIPVSASAAEGEVEVTGDGAFEELGCNVEFFLYTTQLYKMLLIEDSDIDISKVSIGDVYLLLTEKHSIQGNRIFLSRIGLTDAETDYRYLTILNSNHTIEPKNIRGLEINYTENNNSKRIVVPPINIRLDSEIGNANLTADYTIMSSNTDKSIVAFYDNGGNAQQVAYSLWDAYIVETNSALGDTNWPKDPDYIGESYTFFGWDEYKGGGKPFSKASVVTGDTQVFSQKTTTTGEHSGLHIHVMNRENTLKNRFVELYNATNNDSITISNVNWGTTQITLVGNNGEKSNPQYNLGDTPNQWGKDDEYYWVQNPDADEEIFGTPQYNKHIPPDAIVAIEVAAEVNGVMSTVTMYRGVNCGEFSVAFIDDELFEIVIQAAPTPPTGTELEDPDDNTIFPAGAVTIDCTNEQADHADKTYSLIADTYTVSESATWVSDGEGSGYYTAKVTIDADQVSQYVTRYDADTRATHGLVDNQRDKAITLIWQNGQWVADESAPVKYEVACETEPEDKTPEKPDDTWIANNIKVNVNCVDVEEKHTPKQYNLEKYTSTNVEKDDKGYFFTITIEANDYVARYNSDVESTHSLDGSETLTVTVRYTEKDDDGYWVANPSSVTINVKCDSGTTDPEKPAAPDVVKLLGTNAVEVLCVTNNSVHGSKTYGLLDGGYMEQGPEWIQGEEDGYWQYVVTIDAGFYQAQFNRDTQSEHDLASPAETYLPITLIYRDNAWVIEGTEPYATIELVCDSEEPTLPEKPDDETIYDIFNGNKPVILACVTENSGHEEQAFDLIPGSYKIGEVKEIGGRYLCDITIVDEQDYIDIYNTETGKEHTLSSANQPIQVLTLKYTDGEWAIDDDGMVFYKVACEDTSTEPTPEPTPDPTPTPGPGGGDKPPYIPPVDPDDSGVSDLLNTDDHIQYLFGYPEGTFGPENNMTRAEVAQMFYNLLLDQDVTITKTFDDVPANAWYAKAVNTLASLGVVSGVGNGDFEPERSITRAEFTSIAMKFAEGKTGGTNIFSDVKSTDWFYRAVVNSTQYGWIHGYGDGTFRPNNPITRVEVTAIVNNMLGREADVDFVTEHYDELNHFSDLAVSHWGYYHIVEATNDHDYTKPSSGENWTELN